MKKLLLIFVFLFSNLHAEKIKQIANIIGVRDNQLIGYGIVVGLDGTGDGSSSKFTLQSLSNLLQSVNVKIDPNDIKSKNIAAVFVTAKLPPFARQGDKIDATISSIGDAKSLEGGTLLMTPLKGVDGDIYALAQGSVTIGGMNGGARGGKNHATAGSIMNGALIEREINNELANNQNATLSLSESNFLAAIDIQNNLNDLYGPETAIALDSKTIKLNKPENESMVEFLANVLEVEIDYEKEEKIIIDERTGTIVAGVNIQVSPIIITHGAITIKIEKALPSDEQKSENEEENAGTLTLDDEVALKPNANILSLKDGSITIANVTRALNRLGASPKDIISILENIKRAGAIRAKLEII